MQELDYSMIGKRIREARKEKGWSQEILAGKCGISLSFMGHIERGTRNMSLDTFASICNVLKVDAEELLWGIPRPKDTGIANMWDQLKTRNDNSYVLYAKIIKSVADIMNEQ